jgi:hypothetical protein
VRGARAGAQLGYIDVSERACKGFGASLPVSWDSQTETLGLVSLIHFGGRRKVSMIQFATMGR